MCQVGTPLVECCRLRHGWSNLVGSWWERRWCVVTLGVLLYVFIHRLRSLYVQRSLRPPAGAVQCRLPVDGFSRPAVDVCAWAWEHPLWPDGRCRRPVHTAPRHRPSAAWPAGRGCMMHFAPFKRRRAMVGADRPSCSHAVGGRPTRAARWTTSHLR